jgi:nitrate reductase gamma subunit
MHNVYAFVSGPMLWIAFIVFFGGSLYRLAHLIILIHRKEKFIYSYISLKYSLRSIIRWMTPFATENMRRNPVLTLVAFAFHICLLVSPVFLLAHVVLIEEAWSLNWWTLPDSAAILMAVIVIIGCLFFLVRRRISPEVRYVTSLSDYILLAVVAAPFVTGIFSHYQWFNYPLLTILHILSGEILLVAVPFTRLSHMLFALLTRAYMGSEFGGIRHARDW